MELTSLPGGGKAPCARYSYLVDISLRDKPTDWWTGYDRCD